MSLERFLNGGIAWYIDVLAEDESIFLDYGDTVLIQPAKKNSSFVFITVTRGTDIQFQGVGLYYSDVNGIRGFVDQYEAGISFAGDLLQISIPIPAPGDSPDGGGTSAGPIGA